MMILDKEEHREALLQLLKSSTFSGEQIEFVYGLQQSIKSAIIRNQGCPEVLSDAPQDSASVGNFQSTYSAGNTADARL